MQLCAWALVQKRISKIAVIQPTVPSDKQRLAGVEVLCRFKD
jgi:hypothetical protein